MGLSCGILFYYNKKLQPNQGAQKILNYHKGKSNSMLNKEGKLRFDFRAKQIIYFEEMTGETGVGMEMFPYIRCISCVLNLSAILKYLFITEKLLLPVM